MISGKVANCPTKVGVYSEKQRKQALQTFALNHYFIFMIKLIKIFHVLMEIYGSPQICCNTAVALIKAATKF